jgi:hypothetical protein
MIEGRNPAEQYPLTTSNFRMPRISEPNEDEPHVLISLALEDDQRLDLNDWETWLAAFPSIAKYVKVQGVFKSHSNLLLLSLPVMVWDFLPNDPACSFVAFIRSNNLLNVQKPGPEPKGSQVPATSEASHPPVRPPTMHRPSGMDVVERPRSLSNLGYDDAESFLSGTTYRPAESLHSTGGTNLHRMQSAASAPYREPPTDPRLPPRVGEYTSPGSISHTGASPRLRPKPQPSLTSLTGSLKNMPSITSLRTLDRRQVSPLAGTAVGTDVPVSGEGISRTMILNRTRISKKPAFQSDQDVPQGHQMAPHVIRRLEDYFHKDPDPSVAVIEHLASNLGVETSDINVSLFVDFLWDCC